MLLDGLVPVLPLLLALVPDNNERPSILVPRDLRCWLLAFDAAMGDDLRTIRHVQFYDGLAVSGLWIAVLTHCHDGRKLSVSDPN